MYEEATDAIISQLVKKSTPSGLTFIAEKEGNTIVDKMDHLVCFAGAMFALGAYHYAFVIFLITLIIFVPTTMPRRIRKNTWNLEKKSPIHVMNSIKGKTLALVLN